MICFRLIVGDYDGDSKDDLLCHDSSENGTMIMFKLQSIQQRSLIFCQDLTSKIHIADFNKDGKTDLLCQDMTGELKIMITSTESKFESNAYIIRFSS